MGTISMQFRTRWLTDTSACHVEFNKIKTLKADFFMENAAMLETSIRTVFLHSTDIC